MSDKEIEKALRNQPNGTRHDRHERVAPEIVFKGVGEQDAEMSQQSESAIRRSGIMIKDMWHDREDKERENGEHRGLGARVREMGDAERHAEPGERIDPGLAGPEGVRSE